MPPQFLRLTLPFVVATVASCASTVDDHAKKAMVIVPIENAKFEPVIARLPDGPQMAVLWATQTRGRRRFSCR